MRILTPHDPLCVPLLGATALNFEDYLQTHFGEGVEFLQDKLEQFLTDMYKLRHVFNPVIDISHSE